MYEKLMKEIDYAKTSVVAQERLHYTSGRIAMALELGAITSEEYLVLNHECVADGINNPKYF